MRLKQALKTRFPQLTSSQIEKLIGEGRILFKGQVLKRKIDIQNPDLLSIAGGDPKTALSPNPELKCFLLSETDDYFVLNKPCGLHSVALDYDETQSVANWILSLDESSRHVGRDLEAGLLHRLDFETSGVMIAARNQDTYNQLKILWDEGDVQKEYVCLVTEPLKRLGHKTAYMSLKNKNAARVTLSLQAGDFSDHELELDILHQERCGDFTKVFLRLLTGARHQIRAQMALLGHPLVGDELYGGIPAERLMLHAWSLSFEDENQKTVRFEAPCPF